MPLNTPHQVSTSKDVQPFRSIIIHLNESGVIGSHSIISRKDGSKKLGYYTNKELCQLMRAEFLKVNKCKSFQQWADELNSDKNFEGGFTKHDALDSLSSLYNLNIDGKFIDIFAFFVQNLPFKS